MLYYWLGLFFPQFKLNFFVLPFFRLIFCPFKLFLPPLSLIFRYKQPLNHRYVQLNTKLFTQIVFENVLILGFLNAPEPLGWYTNGVLVCSCLYKAYVCVCVWVCVCVCVCVCVYGHYLIRPVDCVFIAVKFTPQPEISILTLFINIFIMSDNFYIFPIIFIDENLIIFDQVQYFPV